jgi:urease accessory protein
LSARRLHEVGRYGSLRLVFRKKGDRTVLQESFSTIPMKAFQPFYPDDTGCACVYMVNSTAGVFGGDRIEIDIALDVHSHVLLSTPSANKLYRGNGGFSSQTVKITLKKGAVLEYLPGYVIPFSGSKHKQRIELYMQEGSTAFVLDFFTTGRVAMGESLQFEEYRSTTEVVYEGEPVVTERVVLRPKEMDYSGLGILERYQATAVLFLVFNNLSIQEPLINALRATLNKIKGAIGGVSTLPIKGVVVRILGPNARIIESAMFKIWSVARRHILSIDNTLSLRRFIANTHYS